MEYTMNNGFSELNAVEMTETDGGFIISSSFIFTAAITIAVGGAVGGAAWALCD